MTQDDFSRRHCRPCEGGVTPMDGPDIEQGLHSLKGWAAEGGKLRKEYVFQDFVGSMAFVNRVAWIAESEGHHPDLAIHYNRVLVEIWTHAVSGLTENDFILAARVDG